MIHRISLALFLALLMSCAISPLGRQQLRLLPDEQLTQMGATAYQEIKQQTQTSGNAGVNSYVNCVADAVTRELGAAPGDWEVTVFVDESANAFALPGGKIGVNTGMLDVAENQHQLATVIAHEVAHVLAKHANERVSTSFATDAGLQLIGALSGADSGTKQTLLGLLGVGAQVGILLPYGRVQESEADLLGLDLMARAGFDPQASVQLWQNMRSTGSGPPEFLSTHPSGQTRIAGLRDRMPQALQIFEQARAAGKAPNCSR